MTSRKTRAERGAITVWTVVLVLPMLVGQVIALVQAAPDLYESVRDVLVERFPTLIQEDSAARQTIADVLASARSQIGTVVSSVLSSAGAAINSVVVLVLAPRLLRESKDPAATGKGLGSRLYKKLIDAIREMGMHAVIGGISLPNNASVGLHEKLGFVKTGQFPEVGYKFDRWVDVGYWHCRLGEPD